MAFKEGSVEPSAILIVASIVSVTTIIVAFLGCMWCRNKWKKLTRRHYQFTDHPHRPSVSPVEGQTEFTLFPPPSSNQFGLPTGISPDEVVFEPLPEIRSRSTLKTAENVRPARFTGSCERVSLQDWFDEYQVNFPRDQLQYLREVGPAWYGQAVEGLALAGDKRRVVVKILRVDATSTELMQYLQEARVCRDLKHPNLLSLLNRCLEVHPFLLIMEHCDMDLKSYMIEQRKSPEALLQNGNLLRMACDITAALQYMHEHGFIHMDVAAHSCLVTSEGVIKLGDYGTAVHLHKSDFYCLGDVAFPIRWCAPETLMCTESVVEAKDITREANIWSFGVVLWELLEFGKMPYVNVSDNDVIQKVLVEGCMRLEQPKTPCAHKDMIYKIMQLCWLPATMRPSVQKISTLLRYLHDNRDVQSETAAFESRWNSLQPNMHRSTPQHTLRFDTDFVTDDCEDLAPRNQGKISRALNCSDFPGSDTFSQDDFARGDKSPSSGSMSLGELQADMSPSLLNLRGSVEDLVAGDTSSSENGLMSGDGNGCEGAEPRALDRRGEGSESGIKRRREDSIKSEDGILDRRCVDSFKSEGGVLNGRYEDSGKSEHVKSHEGSVEAESGIRNRSEESEYGINRRSEDSIASEDVVVNGRCKDPREHATLVKSEEESVNSELGTHNRRGGEDSVVSDPGSLNGQGKYSAEPGNPDRRDEDPVKSEDGVLNRWCEYSVKLENGTLVKSQDGSIESEPETRNKGGEDSEPGTRNRQYAQSEHRTLVASLENLIESERGTFNREHENSTKLMEHDTLVSDYKDSEPLHAKYEDGESEPPSLESVPASDAPDSIQFRISEAIRDLDTILAEETLSEASGCNTPEKRPVGEDANLSSFALNLDDTGSQ